MGWNQQKKNKGDKHRATIKFSLFKTPKYTEGIKNKDGVLFFNLNNRKPLKNFEVDNGHIIQQGICYYKNNIYIPYGVALGGYQGIDVVNVRKMSLVRNFNLMNTSVKEPEAVFFYNKELFIADQGTTIKTLKDE